MNEIEKKPGLSFTEMLITAAKLPGVRISRTSYLISALNRHCTPNQVTKAIRTSPSTAGVPPEVIERIARDSIRFEASKVTALSAAAGLPGALAMTATIPADLAQYLAHMLRISQKLAYIYGWPELFEDDAEDADDGTQAILTLFIGVMMGTQAANAAVGQLATMIAEQIVKKLPQKALTKGVIYPVVKKVAGILGIRMTKLIFARGVSKFVPVIGGAISGGVTLVTFVPMAQRLQKHLAGLELANDDHSTQSCEDLRWWRGNGSSDRQRI